MENNEYWKRMCRDIDNILGYSRSTETWKKSRILKLTRNGNPIQNITSTQWKTHYSILLQENIEQNETVANELHDSSISEEEIKKVF